MNKEAQPKAKETTALEYHHFKSGRRVGVGQCTWDVSHLRYRNPLSWLGRLLGGCAVCGRLWSGCWQVIAKPKENGSQEVLCMKCERFIDWNMAEGHHHPTMAESVAAVSGVN